MHVFKLALALITSGSKVWHMQDLTRSDTHKVGIEHAAKHGGIFLTQIVHFNVSPCTVLMLKALRSTLYMHALLVLGVLSGVVVCRWSSFLTHTLQQRSWTEQRPLTSLTSRESGSSIECWMRYPRHCFGARM